MFWRRFPDAGNRMATESPSVLRTFTHFDERKSPRIRTFSRGSVFSEGRGHRFEFCRVRQSFQHFNARIVCGPTDRSHTVESISPIRLSAVPNACARFGSGRPFFPCISTLLPARTLPCGLLPRDVCRGRPPFSKLPCVSVGAYVARRSAKAVLLIRVVAEH